MDNLQKTLLDQTRLNGAAAVGVATVETLAGGPESADLTRVLEGARAAIVFSLSLDAAAIRAFLSKRDRTAHEKNNIEVNTLAAGIALNLAGFLEMKGHRAKPVVPNNHYRTDTPLGALDMRPELSLRYLAVRSGLGWFGLSGNLIDARHGAGVILGAVVTTAALEPSTHLPPEQGYCDGCRLCMGSCLSGLMAPEEKTAVTLGGVEFGHSRRRSYLRCEYVCGGFTGLHPSGQWSTWSPGRFPVPEKDEEFLPAFMQAIANYSRWPAMENGYYHVLSPHKLYLTCGNCQLVCHPDPEERRLRFRMLTRSGVVIQNPDGALEAVSPEEARKRLDEMGRARRALYEAV